MQNVRTDAAGLVCPACRVDLVMSERQGIEIDYCPRCRGVWLDRGELDKIIERSAAEIVAAPPAAPETRPQYQKDHYRNEHRREERHHDEHRHHKHRRKSFLEEIFD